MAAAAPSAQHPEGCGADSAWADDDVESARWFSRGSAALVPLAFFSDLPLSGQVNLMTIESFDRAGEIFAANAARSVAFVSVNTEAAGGAWAMQGAMTQGDLSSWIVAGSYKSIASANHAYELGLAYSTQRYDGGNAAALGAIRDSARNVGSVYGYDEWTVSPRLVLGYGAGFARYDYLGGPGVWSPRISVTVPLNGVRVKALASQRALVPGAEEFAPSVTGVWLPPERTFSSLAPDGRFTAEQTRHIQLSIERDLAPGVTVSLRGFDQATTDQLVEIFDAVPGRAEARLGHYYVANAGNIDGRGWGVGMTQHVSGYVREHGRIHGDDGILGSGADCLSGALGAIAAAEHGARARSPEFCGSDDSADMRRDFTPRTASTRPSGANPIPICARARMLDSTCASINRFRSCGSRTPIGRRSWMSGTCSARRPPNASIYDEALAIRAPKRIVGGLLVKF